MTRNTSPHGWSATEISPRARILRNVAMESIPALRKYSSRRAMMPYTSATVRRTRSGSRRDATPPTCGRPAIEDMPPPPKSSP